MFVVTTLSYDQLAVLIRDKKVSLNNEDLILGERYEPIQEYIEERLGGSGYVMAIQGRINQASVGLLTKLDRGLAGNKVIIEAPVNQEDLLVFDVKGLDKAIEIINYGLPDELVTEALDEAQTKLSDQTVQVICAPYLAKSSNVRITSINREIDVAGAGITFVRLKKEGTV